MKTNIHFYHISLIYSYNEKCFRQICREIKTHILVSVSFFFFENRAVFENMCKNIVERGRPQTKIWRIRIVCQITKATYTYTHTHTHSEYVILIAFSPQQWLHERALILRYTYIACRVLFLCCVHYEFILKSLFFSVFPSFAKWSRHL